jgi:hypothetical protein
MIDLSSSGELQLNDMDWAGRAREAKELRVALGVQNAVDLNVTRCMERVRGGGTDDLTKRCFFLVLFNRFLFPSGSWHMCNSDIERTKDVNAFNNIDWCQEIYLDICRGIESLHEKLGESQVSYTILGCSIIPAVRASILFFYSTPIIHTVAGYYV